MWVVDTEVVGRWSRSCWTRSGRGCVCWQGLHHKTSTTSSRASLTANSAPTVKSSLLLVTAQTTDLRWRKLTSALPWHVQLQIHICYENYTAVQNTAVHDSFESKIQCRWRTGIAICQCYTICSSAVEVVSNWRHSCCRILMMYNFDTLLQTWQSLYKASVRCNDYSRLATSLKMIHYRRTRVYTPTRAIVRPKKESRADKPRLTAHCIFLCTSHTPLKISTDGVHARVRELGSIDFSTPQPILYGITLVWNNIRLWNLMELLRNEF